MSRIKNMMLSSALGSIKPGKNTIVQLAYKNEIMKRALRDASNILCEGKTFFRGCFNDFEKLSRSDKALHIISTALQRIDS